ncbi:MAG: PAS domain-containing protein, partial [Kineosporiaceae bacterium]
MRHVTARSASDVEALLRLVRKARQDLSTRREDESLGNARPEGDHRRDAVETDLDVVEAATEELRVVEDTLRAEHKALQSARRSQTRWLRTLWDTVPVPVLRTDLAGTLTWVNGGAAALLGTHAEALPRTPLNRYLPVADRKAVRDVLSDLRRGMSTSQATAHLG